MLIILHGANRFARSEYLAELMSTKKVKPEYIEGETFDTNSIASITQGQSLFSEERLVLIDNLSENTDAWSTLAEWLETRELDTDIILLEDKLDKRKASTKALIKKADVKEFTPLKEGDSRVASSWLIDWSGSRGLKLAQNVAMELINRIGYDQGMLANEVERLSVLGEEIDLRAVEKYTPDKLEAKVFSILEAAFKGDKKYLILELNNLRLLSDPYQFLGLLSGQVFQFAALHLSGASTSDISSGLKINSYALQSAQRVRVGQDKVRYATKILADADFKMKSTFTEPWDTIELALVDLALK